MRSEPLRHDVYRLCVVIAVVVLAGCAGIGSDAADRNDTPIETATPVPVPDADTGTVGSSGIDGSGVSDPNALAAAHVERLRGQSYRLVSNQTVRYGNGSVRSQYRMDLRLAENRTYFVTVRTAGPEGPLLLGETPATAEFWSDGETYLRAFGASDPVYNEFSPSSSGVGTWGFWASTGNFEFLFSPTDMIETSLESVPTQVDETRRVDGVDRYSLVETERTDAELPFPEADPARNITLTAEIDRVGLVRQIELEYAAEIDGERVRVTRSITYSGVGTTDVGRPAWFEQAHDGSAAASGE